MEVEDGIKKETQEKDDDVLVNTTLWQYTCQVMSLSLVTGVSAIASTRNRLRSLWKILVLLFCATGFIYQSSEFLRLYLEYPSVVDIQVRTPKEYLAPAYTFCNYNGVKRSKFCSKYPNRCHKPKSVERFCEQFVDFCNAVGDQNVMNLEIPTEEYRDFEKYASFEELKELGHEFKPLSAFGGFESEEVSGPYLVKKHTDESILCYTVNLRVNSSQEPKMITRKRRKNLIGKFAIDLEPDEVFTPNRRPGAIFNFHSPFVFENPIEEGIYLMSGSAYIVRIDYEEETLLPPPFRHRCKNYTKTWKENNRTGPRSQNSCVALCMLQYSLQRWNCTSPSIVYPIQGPFCDYPLLNELDDMEDEAEVKACSKECRIDCYLTKLRYEIQVRYVEEDINNVPEDEITYVNIYISRPEVVYYKHRAQYQDLEVFSYIGGFMGVWIGVSLVAVFDFFEALSRIVTFYFKRRNLVESRTPKRPNIGDR